MRAQTVIPTGPEPVQNDMFDPTRPTVKPAEPYNFAVEWRAEAGYVQNAHYSDNKTYENTYLHGFRVGATADFVLPLHFSIQTGVLYTFTYGTSLQKWGPISYEDFSSPDPPLTGKVYSGNITHRLSEHQLTIPVRMFYTIPLWKELRLLLYTGPQLHVGLCLNDAMDADVTKATRAWMEQMGRPYQPYDRYEAKELFRTTIQYGVGGGLEWDRYRLQAGYDFGLNNQIRTRKISDQQMREWHWYVSAAYRF